MYNISPACAKSQQEDEWRKENTPEKANKSRPVPIILSEVIY